MKPSVLVVEDDPITRFMMGEICDQLGFPHECAATGAECLDMMHNRPDRAAVVMMDIHMPNMSGIEACAKLRKSPSCSKHALRIIAVTADEFWQNPAVCTAAGFDGVLPKPVSIEGIRRALQGAAC